MPKISVISPVYNGQKYIKNFIKSIKRQSFNDFELIIIDDGSIDNTYEIATKELEKMKLNYKIITKVNGGQSSARNLGIKKAKGDYIVFLDSDDTIQKDYLKNMYDVAVNNNSEVVICDINWVNEENIFSESNDEFKFEIDNGKKFFIKFIKHEIEIGPVSLLIKREYLNNLKLFFNEDSRYSEEFIFICHLLHDASRVVHLKQKLYNYCLRSGSVSTGATVDKILNGYNEIIKFNEKYNKCNCEHCKIFKKYAMPRWILATSRFCAKNMEFKNYKKLMISLNYKNEVKKLFSFPSLKIKLAARALNTWLYGTYIVFKIWE